jgi:hypothetical protein
MASSLVNSHARTPPDAGHTLRAVLSQAFRTMLANEGESAAVNILPVSVDSMASDGRARAAQRCHPRNTTRASLR